MLLIKACLLAGFLSACSPKPSSEVQTVSGYAIGTSYSVKMVTSLTEAQRLQLGIERVLADVNSRMSTYLPKSDLSLFSDMQVGEWLAVSERTIDVVQRALTIAEQSEGSFDPTVAELVDLWGFGPTPRQDQKPSDASIQDALTRTGYEAIQVDGANNRLSKSLSRTLDLSAIAKGYAVDLIAEYLLEKGVNDFLVEVGGEMRLSGNKPGDEPWRIAIEDPTTLGRSIHKIFELTDVAVATSGDYRNFFEIDGQRYSHTINPITGYPIDHNLTSVTVLSDNAMDADGWATAFTVMGIDKALNLANELSISAYFIVRTDNAFDYFASEAFRRDFGAQLEAPVPTN